MPSTLISSDKIFVIGYGLLEDLLQDIVGGRNGVIVSRFRKLRPKLAADGLLTETGNHVAYDLKRILAISAIFQLNALAIPQAHAVDIVVRNWAEIAQTFLQAQALATRQSSESLQSEGILHIYIDALTDSPEVTSWALLQPDDKTGMSHLAIDCHRVVALLAQLCERQPAGSQRLSAAFDELHQDFGPATGQESHYAVVPKPIERSLFSDGPYFARARSLLSAEPSADRHPLTTSRLQTYLDYLENPAPVDRWKAHLGTKAEEPRLGHFLSAWGVEIGLSSNTIGSVDTLQTAAMSREQALKLISGGERHAF